MVEKGKKAIEQKRGNSGRGVPPRPVPKRITYGSLSQNDSENLARYPELTQDDLDNARAGAIAGLSARFLATTCFRGKVTTFAVTEWLMSHPETRSSFVRNVTAAMESLQEGDRFKYDWRSIGAWLEKAAPLDFSPIEINKRAIEEMAADHGVEAAQLSELLMLMDTMGQAKFRELVEIVKSRNAIG